MEPILQMAKAMVNATLSRYLIDGYGYPYKVNTTSGAVVDYTMVDYFPYFLHIYSLTGNRAFLSEAAAYWVREAYNWTGKFFCNRDLLAGKSICHVHEGNEYAPLLMTLYYTWLTTGNDTYLEVLKDAINTILKGRDSDGIIANYVSSDGTTIASERVFTHQLVFGPVALYTLGVLLGNETVASIARANLEYVLGYASPMLPISFNRTSDAPCDTTATFSGWGVPCLLADCIRLLRYEGKDYSLLMNVSKVLVNTWMLHAEKDPLGLEYPGLLDYKGNIVAAPTEYRFFHQMNHLRFVLLYYLLTGNKTVLSFVQEMIDRIERCLRAPHGYYGSISASDLRPLDTGLCFQFLCKYLGLLARMYLITGNTTYLEILKRNIEEALPLFLDKYGVALMLDAETGAIRSDIPTGVLLIYEGLRELLSAFFWQDNGVLWSDAVGRLKVSAFGVFNIFERKFVLHTTVREGCGRLRAVLPCIARVEVNGEEWLVFNSTSVLLRKGYKILELELGPQALGLRVEDISGGYVTSAFLTNISLYLTVDSGGTSVLTIYAAERGMPACVASYTWLPRVPSMRAFRAGRGDCWYYDEARKLIYIKICGYGPLKVVLIWLGRPFMRPWGPWGFPGVAPAHRALGTNLAERTLKTPV